MKSFSQERLPLSYTSR